MRIIWELSSENQNYHWELSSENYHWELSSENYHWELSAENYHWELSVGIITGNYRLRIMT